MKISNLVVLMGIVACSFLLAFPTSVNAQSSADWKPKPSNLIGFDGVGIRCVVSSDRKFVHDICKILIDATQKRAESKDLKIANSGVSWERNPDAAYLAALASAEIANPLLLEFFIRGTDGDPVSGAVHILASVEYKAAIEQGVSDAPARSGRLVIWENAGTGSGDVNQMAAALGNHMAKKLDLLFGAF